MPKPEVKEGWLLIRLEAIPICGSDLKLYVADNQSGATGHEGAGVVAESGSALFKPGDRVIVPTLAGCGVCEVCRTGEYIYCTSPLKEMPTPTQAEYCLAPAHLTLRIPDELTAIEASMAGCALSPAYGSLRRFGLHPGAWVMVTGIGPVGLGATFIAHRMGLKVLAVDLNEDRLEQARRVGADATLVSHRDITARDVHELINAKPHAAVECSGSAAATKLALSSLATKGQLALVGASDQEFSIQGWRDIIQHGITVFGQWHAGLRQLEELLDFMVHVKDDLHLLISECLPLSKAHEAYEIVAQQNTAKVVLIPDQAS